MEALMRLVDGGPIREALPAGLAERARKRFEQAGSPSLSSEQVRAAAEAEAAALLLGSELSSGLPLPAAAAHRLPGPDAQLDEAAFESTLRDYLQAVADVLKDEPIVVSVLDGSNIRELLEDEDELAMAAESVFTDLDKDDSGKLSRGELRRAVEQLTSAMGFPPASANSEINALVSKLLTKYAGQDSSNELGQTQFAQLLQDVLQDLADSLAARPIAVVRDVKILDGSYLSKVLEDDKLFAELSESTFKDLDANGDGKLSRSEIRPMFESRAVQWGLPPHDESANEEIYRLVFAEVDADKSGYVDKQEFRTLMRAIFESFVMQLKTNPIVVEMNTASQATLRIKQIYQVNHCQRDT